VTGETEPGLQRRWRQPQAGEKKLSRSQTVALLDRKVSHVSSKELGGNEKAVGSVKGSNSLKGIISKGSDIWAGDTRTGSRDEKLGGWI